MQINIFEFLIKILSVLIPLCIATIYAFKDFKKRNGKLKPIGVFVIILLCLTIPLATWDYFNSISAKIESDKQADKKTRERDSINLIKNAKADSLLYNAFAKYGLKYDKAEQRISKLVKDSARVNIINSPNPDFGICSIKAKDTLNTLHFFEINFCSKIASSYNINITTDLISFDNYNNLYYVRRNLPMLARDLKISKDDITTFEMVEEKRLINRAAIFHTTGSFKTDKGTLIPINQFTVYDFDQKFFGSPKPKVYEKLLTFVSEK